MMENVFSRLQPASLSLNLEQQPPADENLQCEAERVFLL